MGAAGMHRPVVESIALVSWVAGAEPVGAAGAEVGEAGVVVEFGRSQAHV